MADRIEGNVRIIETTGLPAGFTPPEMSVTKYDAPLRCSEEDCRPGRGGLHDVERIRRDA